LSTKRNVKNDKIYREKNERNNANEKSEKSPKNHERPDKSSRIYRLSFEITQITGDIIAPAEEGNLGG
jgi:hypothetical protein